MTVAVTGSMAFDYIMSFPDEFAKHILPDQIQRLSVSFLVDSMRRERGGTAGNIAYNLALLDQPALLMATVGQDAPEYIAGLQARGVDVSGVLQLSDEFTASFFVSTDQTNNQIALFYTGAMAKAGRISFADQDYQKIKLAIISPNDPWAMVKYAQECHDLRIPYIYDPSQQIPRLEADDLVRGIEGAQILMLNDYEYEMIKNKTGLSEAGIKARVETLIVTQGEKGSFIHSEGHDIHIPVAKPNRIADPTGVGDAYRAGLIAGIIRGYPWEVAGRLGSVTAVYVLEQHGTQRHTYNRQLVANRYRDHFGHTDELDDFVSFSPGSI